VTSLFSAQELREALKLLGATKCTATRAADGQRIEFAGALHQASADAAVGLVGGMGDAPVLKYVATDCPGLDQDDEVLVAGARYQVREVRVGQSGLARAAVQLIRGPVLS